MKKIFGLALGLLAVFGISHNATAATNSDTNSAKKNLLYLVHANEYQSKGNAINWHASHESHYSHQSHHSHYSSYN